MAFHLQFLGTPLIQTESQNVTSQLPSKAIGLLAFLAVEKQPVTRNKIADLLWSAESESKGKHNLRQLLQNIKKVLPHILVLKGRDHLALNDQLIDFVDIWQFEDAYLSQAYQQAAMLLRGSFLEGLRLRNADNFDQWLRLQESAIHNKSIKVLETLLRQRNRNEAVIQFASLLISLEPWHEEAYQKLMLAQARAGRFNEALSTYVKCEKALQDELSMVPTRQTMVAYERVQMARRTLHQVPSAVANAFVGRQKELDQIEQLLADPTCRCLTLLGMGGMGKTRLAQEAGQRFQSLFLHGVCFVPLLTASADSKLGIMQLVLNSLGIAGDGHALDEQLISYLRPREMLLILDNFEQIVAQAGFVSQILQQAPDVKIMVTSRNCLDIPEEWLFDVPGLSVPKRDSGQSKIVETMRNGFQKPDTTHASYDAVALLQQRAQQLGCTLVWELEQVELGQICQKLAGVPLAVELIAPWLRTNTPAEILQLMTKHEPLWLHANRNFPARHRDLFAVFEHSWQLLSNQEQLVLESLVCFEGDFTETAALTVAQTDKPTLALLVNHSILQTAGPGRYKIHSLLRIFLENKAGRRNTAVHATARHYRYYRQFALQMLNELNGSDQFSTLKQCEAAFANLRAAWMWGGANISAAEMMPFAEFLFELCSLRNWFETGIQIFEVAHEQETEKQSLFASRLLAYSGFFYQRMGYFETAVQRAQQALKIAQLYEDSKSILQALTVLSNVHFDVGQYVLAEQELQKCLIYANTSDLRKERAYCFYRLGLVISLHIDYPNAGKKQPYKPPGPFITEHYTPTEAKIRVAKQAREYYAKARAIYQQLGDAWGVAIALHATGFSWYQVKAYEKAIDCFEEAVQTLSDLEAGSDLTQSLNWLAWTIHRKGNNEVARDYFMKAIQTGLENYAEKYLLDCLMKFALFLWVTEKSHALPLTIASLVANHPNTDSRMRNSAEEWVENISDFISLEEQNAALNVAEQYALRAFAQKILLKFQL